MLKRKSPKHSQKRTLAKRPSLAQVLIVLGLVLCVLPLLSNFLFQTQSSQSASAYAENTSQIDSEMKEQILEQARAYNAHLGGYTDNRVSLSIDEILPYEEQLSVDGETSMGWIEIPKAGITASIYHGVKDDVLAMGVGHQSETSLPVGGDYSHCFISGHSGMAQYQIFDNIRVLEEGDVFALHVLDDIYAYRVIDWEIIDPDDVSLSFDKGDYVTLVTCTTDPDALNPKGRTGINDKRLLVTAERCEYSPEEFENTSPDMGVYINDFTRPFLIAAGLLIVVGICLLASELIRGRHRFIKKQNDLEDNA